MSTMLSLWCFVTRNVGGPQSIYCPVQRSMMCGMEALLYQHIFRMAVDQQ